MLKNLVFILIFLCAVSCENNRKQAEPDKIVLGFVTQDDPQGTMAYHKLLADYLQKTLKLKKVELFTSSDYASIIEAMKAKKVDVAQTGELSYILAHQNAGAEAMVIASLPGRFIPTGSVIITYPGSGLNSMEDVKANAKKLTLLFSDPASTSGHLYPRDYLTKIGLNPESSFKQVSFSSGHTAAVLSIKSHRVELACTYKLGLARLERKGFITKSDYKILWTSGNYPNPPYYIRGDLPEKFKKKVQQAFIDLPVKDPVTWKAYRDKALLFFDDSIRKQVIYIPCQDSTYNSIRAVIRNVKGFNFGLK